jgi:serine/threonine protein kinase
VHLAYSLHYAAPEVIRASELSQGAILASAALDIWSLGVVAFELLTGQRIVVPAESEQSIRDRLMGRAPLPWEDELRSASLLSKLKGLKRSVLKCLSREPRERPTSPELLGAWNGMFEAMTGKTTATYVPKEPASH